MSISSNLLLSQPAEFRVVSTAVSESPSAVRSFKNLINPSPPVRGDTPDTWAEVTGMSLFAPAASPRSTSNLMAFCLVEP